VTFADTFYFLAILNPRDSNHALARQASATLSGKLITTLYVLTEVGDALAAPSDRKRFLALLETLGTDPEVLLVPASDDLFHGGVSLYRQRPDKDWPLSDCLSFVVMQEHGIVDALTGDLHFRQAGFRPLLLPA
jgi:hypothetical protein